MSALYWLTLAVSSAQPAVPADWLVRSARGQLVWAQLPVHGPLPNFGNGYIAAQYSPSASAGEPCMYIAGVMSGGLPPPFGNVTTDAISQRAPIPLLLAGVAGPGWQLSYLANDLEQATVQEVLVQGGASLRLTHYAHRAAMHLLVSQAVLNNSAGHTRLAVPIHVPWRALTGGAVRFEPVNDTGQSGVACQLGETAVAEPGAALVQVAVCYPSGVHTLAAAPGAVASSTLITSIVTSLESPDPLSAALQALRSADRGPELAASHSNAQLELWASRIELAGDMDLALSVNASLYGILISVRAGLNYSTSPGGLPNGCYHGHVFWDTEQFIWPNLLLLHPELARAALQYRAERVEAARRNSAQITGTAGLKFPWESAVTGLASTTASAHQNEEREIHIDGDVSLAMFQYWQASGDKHWLNSTGWPVLEGVAQFWASRLTYNNSRLTLVDAGGPDESNSHATDNTYDLASALHSLRHAVAAAQVLGLEEHVGANWTGLIEALPAAFAFGQSPSGGRMIRCWAGGSEHCNGIGVVMLRYPLNLTGEILPDSVHREDLDYYSTQWPNGNAMYWSMFTIGYSDIGEHLLADHYLAKSTANNLFGPFKVWSEAPGGGGCPNFLTGAGVYLQSIWAGYAGLRFADDSLQIRAPRPPPGCTALILRGVKYKDRVLDVEVTAGAATLTLVQAPVGQGKLRVYTRGKPSVALEISQPVGISPNEHAFVFVG